MATMEGDSDLSITGQSYTDVTNILLGDGELAGIDSAAWMDFVAFAGDSDIYIDGEAYTNVDVVISVENEVYLSSEGYVDVTTQMTGDGDGFYIDSEAYINVEAVLVSTAEVSIAGDAYLNVDVVIVGGGEIALTGDAYVNVTVVMVGEANLPRIYSTTEADIDFGLYGDANLPLITSSGSLAVGVEAIADGSDCVWIGAHGVMVTTVSDSVLRYGQRSVIADTERVESEETPSILRYVRA